MASVAALSALIDEYVAVIRPRFVPYVPRSFDNAVARARVALAVVPPAVDDARAALADIERIVWGSAAV